MAPSGCSAAWRKPSRAGPRGGDRGRGPFAARRAGSEEALPRQQGALAAYRPALELITGFAINWCVIAAATSAAGRIGIPELERGGGSREAVGRHLLCTRADLPDPIGAWEVHSANLARRTAFLNDRRYRALKYTGPGTDLVLGWRKSMNGWAAPAVPPQRRDLQRQHPDRGSLHLSAQGHGGRLGQVDEAPLYQGSLIDGIRCRFERGASSR